MIVSKYRPIEEYEHKGVRLREILNQHEIWLQSGGTKGEQADLQKAILNGVNLHGVNLSHAVLAEANLQDVIFIEAALVETDLHGANLWRTQFQCASLVRADLRNGFLRGSNFWAANLAQADLRGSDIQGANLEQADLQQADLTDSKLNVALLFKADLSGSIMTGVKLYGANRTGWNIKNVECEYIFLGEDHGQRFPKERDFLPGEFEKLFTEWPTIEYVFENGMTPRDMLLISIVAQNLANDFPESSVELSSIERVLGYHVAKFRYQPNIEKEKLETLEKGIEIGFEKAEKVYGAELNRLGRIIERDHGRGIVFNAPVSITGNIQNIEGDQINITTQAALFDGIERVIKDAIDGSDLMKSLLDLEKRVHGLEINRDEVAGFVQMALALQEKKSGKLMKFGDKILGVLDGAAGSMLAQAVIWGIQRYLGIPTP